MAILSARTPLMGRNLMAHLRSDLAIRIRCPRGAARSRRPRSSCAGRRRSALHLQLTASTSAGGSDATARRRDARHPPRRPARVVASTALGQALTGDSAVVIAIEPGHVAVLTSA